MRKLFKSLVADKKDTKIALFMTLQRSMKNLVRKQTSVNCSVILLRNYAPIL